VFYPDGWQQPGENQSDMNGLHGSALELKKQIISGEF